MNFPKDLALPAVAICVPVRNEQELLPRLLAACGGLDLRGVDATLCLYLDGCTDRSDVIAQAAGAALPMPVRWSDGIRHPDANAGRARAAAMAMGLAVLPDAGRGVLLSTDADSRPEPDWVRASLVALSHGEVAAGRLVLDDAAIGRAQARVERYYDRLHTHRRRIDPVAWEVGGCHCAGGANMAIRADAYRASGGFHSLPWGEDARFVDDAARGGLRVRHDAAMRVVTSARRRGRIAGGLASALDDLDRNGLPLVEHPAAADWQYRMQAMARRAFADIAEPAVRDRIGRPIGLDGDHVLGVARDCPNAEAFAMRIVPAAPIARSPIPLAEAEDALTAIERTPCAVAA